MDAAGLSYHNIRHSMGVKRYCEHLCKKMGVRGNYARLMGVACLYHDLGYIVQYRQNEAYGAGIAGNWLPGFGFSSSEVALVKRMIMATQMPQKPKDMYEKIICDADLSNLGMRSFWKLSGYLRAELGIKSDKKWYSMQIGFLGGHTYHTETAQMELEPLKQRHLRQLRGLVSRHARD